MPQAAKLPRTSGLFKKKVGFLRTSFALGSEAARGKWLVQKKVGFLRKVLPQAAKLPRTSGSVARKRTTIATKGAERLFGGSGRLEPPGKAGGCGGGAAPRLPPPNLSHIYS